MSDPRWQPIETAPKDQPVLVHPSHWNGYTCDIARWDDDRYRRTPRPFWRRMGAYSVSADRKKPPTHWMPLPAPPSDLKASQTSPSLPR